IASYYNANTTTEHARLISNRVEFEISLRTILAHLPAPKEGAGLKIADIGGGTGRYAVELAKRGHNVTLLDISSSELSLAAQYAQTEGVQLEGIHIADASALFTSCPSLLTQLGTFDIVLLLGPLYHLLEEEERVSAVRDAARLLKPCFGEDRDGEEDGGGVLLASFLTTFGHLRGVARGDPGRLTSEWGWYEGYLGLGEGGEENGEEKGKYTRRKAEGVVSHHVHPSEIRGLFEKVNFSSGDINLDSSRANEQNRNLGLQVQKVIACESFLGAEFAASLNTLREEEWRVWMDVLARFASDECVLGASEHLLAV
ncbi:S-adenosyl-L-methionine-dependent methyltransferase, partial [Cadophora sp. DSE1049]